MPAVKTPEERGPSAWWAYRTRDRIHMSVEQVVALLATETDTSTLRKAEGDSRNMSRRLLRELADVYRREYRERGRDDFEEPPGGPPRRTDTSDELVSLVREMLVEIRAEREARQEWERGLLQALGELARGGAPSGDPSPEPHGAAQG